MQLKYFKIWNNIIFIKTLTFTVSNKVYWANNDWNDENQYKNSKYKNVCRHFILNNKILNPCKSMFVQKLPCEQKCHFIHIWYLPINYNLNCCKHMENLIAEFSKTIGILCNARFYFDKNFYAILFVYF